MPALARPGPLRLILGTALLAGIALLCPTGNAEPIEIGNPLVVPEDPDVLQDFYVDDGPLNAKKVAMAMRKGTAWLKRKQGRSGSWGAIAGNAQYGGGRFDGLRAADESLPSTHGAGPTALALYALLRCRVPANDPIIRRGLCYLYDRHKRPAGSFETSMVLLALTATAEKQPRSKRTDNDIRPKLSRRYRAWAMKLRERLVEQRRARGWRYNLPGQSAAVGGPEDISSTWLATLALFEAQRLGLKTRAPVWEDILRFTLEQQDDDGPEVKYVDPADPKKVLETRARGFAYIKGQEGADHGQATGGMTACAVATIEMVRFVLSRGGRKRARWNKRRDATRVQQALFDGLAWLERNWQPFENPRKERVNINHGYWWFALESATSLTAVKHIGTHAWFSETGQELINNQREAGHWNTNSSAEPMDTLDTCFALLSLARNAHGLIAYPSVRGGSTAPPNKAK